MWGVRALGALSGGRLSDGAAAACSNTGGGEIFGRTRAVDGLREIQ